MCDMIQQQIEGIQNRFRNFGFTPFEEELKVSLISGNEKGRLIYIDALLAIGKLRFAIDLANNIDAMTGNILAYTGSLQKNIEIPETTIEGVSVRDLELRVKELDYITDPFSSDVTERKEWLQTQFDLIGKSEKRNAKNIYELLLAKYWNRFSFGEKAFIIATRERVLSSFYSQMKIGLLEKSRLLPWDVYLELSGLSGRKRKAK